MRTRIALAALAVSAALGAAFVLHGHRGPIHYTGFVEGEERVLRSEVSGRVLEVDFAEGDRVPADAVIARIDDSEIAARASAKEQELRVIEAEIARQQAQVELADETWQKDVAARRAALREAQAGLELAERTYKRQRELEARGVAPAQRLDEARSRRDQARSAVDQARDLLARAQAEEGQVTVARHQLQVLRQQHELAVRQLAEIHVDQDKYVIRAPNTETVVQTQLLWPDELAQPGTPVLSVLDPRDKYVQIYVPVSDLDRVRVGRPVSIELDSRPGRRFRGEVSFIADQANFTPEKIETRSDRLGQVYRAKVRILEDVESFQPGTEGDVYLTNEAQTASATARVESRGR